METWEVVEGIQTRIKDLTEQYKEGSISREEFRSWVIVELTDALNRLGD